MEGLEPPCLAAIDPKSIASTNFATSAFPGVFLLCIAEYKHVLLGGANVGDFCSPNKKLAIKLV